MKTIYTLFFASLLFSFNTQAYSLQEQESMFFEIKKLNDEIKKIELEKKLSDLKVAIRTQEQNVLPRSYFGNESSNDSGLTSKSGLTSNENMFRFHPAQVKVNYIIIAGETRHAVLLHNGASSTVKDGDLFNGWRVKVTQDKVTLFNSSESIEI
ncbi:MAG: hypothetical protein ACRCTB_08730 [Vibrio sp.]